MPRAPKRPTFQFTAAAVREAAIPAGYQMAGCRYRSRNARLDITLSPDQRHVRLDFRRLLTTAKERKLHAAIADTRLRYVRRGIVYTHLFLRPEALLHIAHFAELLALPAGLSLSATPLHRPSNAPLNA
jgi:hypothetical protein